MTMKFMGRRALRAKFPDAKCIVQVRVITERDSTIDAEGPVSAEAATWMVRLAVGHEAPPLPVVPDEKGGAEKP